MGVVIGPAGVRNLTSALLALVGLLVAACVAFGASAEFSERDLLPPAKRSPAAQPVQVRTPATRSYNASYAQDENASQDEDYSDDEPAQSSSRPAQPPARPAAPVGPAAAGAPPAAQAAAPTVAANGDLNYIVHPGDSVGAIAAMFHLSTADILRRNHLSEDTMLQVGRVLHIPNPYAAQVRELENQLNVLRARAQQQDHRIDDLNLKQGALNARITELSGINQALEHDVTTLPWWRRATELAVAAATLMFGITMLSLLQWFVVRRRFVSVSQANIKLSRLDQRYRALHARAELRLQQLYGRRRAPADSSTPARSPEDFELERLNRELKEVLEEQLAQLGVQMQAPARRSRLREWLANIGAPVAVRSDRR